MQIKGQARANMATISNGDKGEQAKRAEERIRLERHTASVDTNKLAPLAHAYKERMKQPKYPIRFKTKSKIYKNKL